MIFRRMTSCQLKTFNAFLLKKISFDNFEKGLTIPI